MDIGINAGFVRLRRNAPNRSLEEALALCKDAGFTKINYLSPVKDDDYVETAKRQREIIESFGMTVEQSHCPYFRYEEDGIRKFGKYAPRAVEAAAILGSPFLVIHADEFIPEQGFEFEEVLNGTKEYLAPVVERCVKHGVRPAIENLFEDGCKRPAGQRSRFTSTVEEVLAVIDAFPGSGAGCCWDSGHMQCSYGEEELPAALEKLADRIVCTHIHDNSMRHDFHKPAFFGNLKWEEAMAILKKAGYNGVFSWEFVYERMPDALMPDYLRFMHRIAEHLVSL